MDALLELSRTLTDLVAATPGVREVYPASKFRELISSSVLAAERQGLRVSVHHRGGGLDVYANICVDAEYSLPTVLRNVGDAIATVVRNVDAAPAHIAVTASRIQ